MTDKKTGEVFFRETEDGPLMLAETFVVEATGETYTVDSIVEYPLDQ